MIQHTESARQLAGRTGGGEDLVKIHTIPILPGPMEAMAFNAVDSFPEEADALLNRCGLFLELVFAHVPAAMLRHIRNEEAHGVGGAEWDIAADFWDKVERFHLEAWPEAKSALEWLIAKRGRHWLPVVLRVLADEIEEGNQVARPARQMLAIWRLLRAAKGVQL